MNFTKKEIKLFIISGKARSGKDEVSKIIKNYYKEKKSITISFAYYLKDYINRIYGNFLEKPRDILQEMGIDLIKNKIDNKLLINRIIQDIEVFSYFYDIIIVSDARLIDEIESLKKIYNKSISIRINRDDFDNGLTKEQKNHITEVNLDNYNGFDYVVNNSKNLEKEVVEILRSV